MIPPKEKTPADRWLANASPSLILGLFLVAVGVLVTLDNLDIVDTRVYWRFWPVVLVMIGLARWVSGGRTAGLIWIAIGSWLLLGKLGLVSVQFWHLWPGLIPVIIGVTFIRKALRPNRPRVDESQTSDAVVRMLALMSGSKRTNASPIFRGGELIAVMGGLELDLRHATPEGGEAVIDAFAFMGGIEIKVGPDWTVVLSGLPVMGGFEDKTEPPATPAGKRLVIHGVALMGGIVVSN